MYKNKISLKNMLVKKIVPSMALALLIMGASQSLVSAVGIGYSVTPTGLGNTKYTSSVVKATTSSAENKCSKVQGGGSLYSQVFLQSSGDSKTASAFFTSGQDKLMDYYAASTANGNDMKMGVQSQLGDIYGRNTYGYWSPDDF